MIVLKPVSTPQTVSVFLRSESLYYLITLTNEQSQVESIYLVQGVYDSGSLTFDLSHGFQENRFYYLNISEWNFNYQMKRVVLDNGINEAPECLMPLSETMEIGINLNKSKIFITAQPDLEKYSLTNDFYTIIKKDEREFTIKG